MSKFVDSIKKSDLKPTATTAKALDAADTEEASLDEYLASFSFTDSATVKANKPQEAEPYEPLV